MDLRQRILHGLRWTFSARFIAQAITWCSTLVVIRLLTPTDYGLMAMAQTSAAVMNILLTAGIADGLIHSRQLTDRVVSQVAGLLVLIGGGFFCLQLACATPLSIFFSDPSVAPIAGALAVLFLATPWIVISETLLTRDMKFRGKSLIDLGATVISATLSLALALAGAGVWALVAAVIAIAVIRAVGLSLLRPLPQRPIFNFTGMSDQFGFGASVALGGIIFAVYSNADVVIGGYALSAQELGLYATALQLASMPMTKVIPLINQVAFPAFAAMQVRDGQLRRNFLSSIRLAAAVVFPLFFGMAAVASELVATVFGPRWAGMVVPLMILAIGMPFRTLTYMFTPLFKAVGRPGLDVTIGLITLATLLPALALGVHWGEIGLASAWLVVFPLVFAFTAVRGCRALGLGIGALIGDVAPPALAASGMFLFIRYADSVLVGLGVPAWLILAYLVPAGAIAYIAAVWLGLRGFRHRILADVRRLRGIVPAAQTLKLGR